MLAKQRRFHVLVPDLLYAEVGNGLWKKLRRGDLTEPIAQRLLRAVRRAPFQVRPARPLVARALELARETGRTVYDSLYLALARRHRCLLATADERFYNAILAGPYAAHIRWFADRTLTSHDASASSP